MKFWFEDLKRDGALKEGKKKIIGNDGNEWDYEGPIDENGVACGIGKATRGDDPAKRDNPHSRIFDWTYTGSFVNDKFEGVGILARREKDTDEMPHHWTRYSEFKEGVHHGLADHHGPGPHSFVFKMDVGLTNWVDCFGSWNSFHMGFFQDYRPKMCKKHWHEMTWRKSFKEDKAVYTGKCRGPDPGG